MNWYDHIACFFAGMFLANVVPHFVHGISGERSPGALESAHRLLLFRAGNISSGDDLFTVTRLMVLSKDECPRH